MGVRQIFIPRWLRTPELAIHIYESTYLPSMSPKKYTWITLWFLITGPMILWDAGYVLARPYSMEGGSLRWFWSYFELFERIDNVYSVEAYHQRVGFAPAAAVANLIEMTCNVAYLYSVYIVPRDIAPLFGMSGAGLTLFKTIIWVLQEQFCGHCSYHAGRSTFSEILQFWIAPNVVWAIFCSMIIIRLGSDISSALSSGNQTTTHPSEK